MAIITLALAGTAKGDGCLEILTPPPQVSVSSDRIHVVGRTAAPVVRVTLNGVDLSEVETSDSVFHAHVGYGYGLNEIRLTPVFGDSVCTNEAKTVEVLHGPSVERSYQRVFPEYAFHDGKEKVGCTTCHRSASANLSQVVDDATCIDCHADFKGRFISHTNDDRVCLACHNLASSGAGHARPGQNLCFQCHHDKMGEYAQEYIHGPVAGGGCVICHDPHGSPYEKSLHNPVNILCFSCHQELEKDLSEEYVHVPFAEGRCEACHDPHSTNNRWVLVKSSEVVCMGCHQEQGTLKTHSHPYNVAPKNPLQVKLELTDRGTLECVSCHNPHTSEAAHLLRISQSDSCIACHEDKK